MKKFFVLVAVLCAVMISSTAAAAIMPDWKLVKEITARVQPDPKYNLTPDQYYSKKYLEALGRGLSEYQSARFASNLTKKYRADWKTEQLKSLYAEPQKTRTIYIDRKSVSADWNRTSGVAFKVRVREVYTPFGRNVYIADLRKKGEAIPDKLKNLSYVVATIHFKSTDEITKYYAITDAEAFTTEGKFIEDISWSSAPLEWEFVNPDDVFDLIFEEASRYLPR